MNSIAKKARILGVFAAAGVLTIAGVSAACEGNGRQMTEQERAKKAEERFRKKDTNGDGFLTQAEVGQRWEWLKKADANGDSKVSLAELQQAKKEGKLRKDKPRGDQKRS